MRFNGIHKKTDSSNPISSGYFPRVFFLSKKNGIQPIKQICGAKIPNDEYERKIQSPCLYLTLHKIYFFLVLFLQKIEMKKIFSLTNFLNLKILIIVVQHFCLRSNKIFREISTKEKIWLCSTLES